MPLNIPWTKGQLINHTLIAFANPIIVATETCVYILNKLTTFWKKCIIPFFIICFCAPTKCITCTLGYACFLFMIFWVWPQAKVVINEMQWWLLALSICGQWHLTRMKFYCPIFLRASGKVPNRWDFRISAMLNVWTGMGTLRGKLKF